ncbi:MAG: hypothetical protein FWH28_01000 [Clostridiales bacterium]|nr:hypothetical protein [Clostridiales bacterium]
MRQKRYQRSTMSRYLTVMAVLTVCILCGLTGFWLYLDHYEKSLSYHTAERIFDAYFAEPDYDALYALEKKALFGTESSESYKNYVRGNATGKRSCRNVPSGEARVEKYAVYADGARFAEFELVRGAGGQWGLSGMSAVLDRAEETKIIVPAGSRLYVNGFRVGEEYHSGGGIPGDDGIPGDCVGPQDVYRLNGVLVTPAIEARDDGGNSASLVYDREAGCFMLALTEIHADILEGGALYINDIAVSEEQLVERAIQTEAAARLNTRYQRYRVAGRIGGILPRVVDRWGRKGEMEATDDNTYIQKILYDAELEQNYSALAKDAATTYSKYMTYDSSMTEIRRYFAPGTAIYEAIRTSEVIWYTNHIGYRFENVVASEFFPREEGAFSCRVTLDHYVQRTAADLRHFPLDITLFFTESDGKYLVTDMLHNPVR